MFVRHNCGGGRFFAPGDLLTDIRELLRGLRLRGCQDKLFVNVSTKVRAAEALRDMCVIDL
jgi:hypothetical protein